MYLYQTTFTMTVQATVFAFLSMERNTVRTSLLKEKLFSTVTNYVQRNTSLYQCEVRYPHIRLLRDPVLWTGFSFAHRRSWGTNVLLSYGGPLVPLQVCQTTSVMPDKLILFGKVVYDTSWGTNVWHRLCETKSCAKQHCMTPAISHTRVRIVYVYDAGQENVWHRPCITYGGSSNPLQVSRETLCDDVWHPFVWHHKRYGMKGRPKGDP